MIPNTAHFIWLGKNLPWVYVLAVRSAALRGGFQQVVLHHEDDLSETPYWAELIGTPGVTTRRLKPRSLLLNAGPRGVELADLYARLSAPASRANMIRAAVLATEGGVYLDTDTVTVASLTPLLDTGVFCGTERIALPAEVMRSRRPSVWLKAAAQLTARDACRRLPRGWRSFRRIQRFYPLAVNNAVFGAEPGHPLVMDLLDRMVNMPPKKQLVRYALGTNLLQDMVADYAADDLEVHPPGRFYPLAPEISAHWFRGQRQPLLHEIVRPETRVVHWYASVHTKKIVPLICPGYVRRNAHRQLFSALSLQFVA